MKYILCSFTLIFFTFNIHAQITCSANSDTGSAYDLFENAGLAIENPDCEHTGFGSHLTQIYDSLLQKNVFEFHSHIVEDNDRCMVFDRVRMEIKGGPGTDAELQHEINTYSYYRWKFQIPADFEGSSNFCHIFQNKIYGGDDSSFPVITLTPRTDVIQIIHNGGDSGEALGVVSSADLDLFKGQWIEAYIKQYHAENGEIEVILTNFITGDTLINYSNNDIDLWRTGAEYDRPKWGIYRKKDDNLKDEIIRFADFCISETSSDLCPHDTQMIVDTIAPSTPFNLQASQIMIHSLNLSWDSSEDLYGIDTYHLYQDDIEIWSGEETESTVENLEGSTTYSFTVRAKDNFGNYSEYSAPLSVTTDDADTLPEAASNPNPENDAVDVSLAINLKWKKGENTDSQKLYFGTDSNPALLSELSNSEYFIELNPDTKYFWQIGGINENGETLSDLWTFTTAAENADFPWKTYRANARLDEETSFLELKDYPAIPLADEILPDPNGSPNTYYRYWDDSSDKFRWRYAINPTDSMITVVARIKAISADVNCLTYFEIRNKGTREKVRINQSTVKLERSEPLVEEDIPFEFKDDFHLIRVTKNGNTTSVFLDENPEPMAVGISGDDDTNTYFEWGKSGSNECGCQIDWMVILDNEAYAPNEGPELPEDLFLSSNARLQTLQVNGENVVNFDPMVFEYTVPIEGNQVPELSYTNQSPLATTIVENPATVPNSTASIEVTAQDQWTVNTYLIHYEELVSTNSIENKEALIIYPNPADNVINLDFKNGMVTYAEIYDVQGKKRISQSTFHDTKMIISSLEEGMYYLILHDETGKKVFKKFIIQR